MHPGIKKIVGLTRRRRRAQTPKGQGCREADGSLDVEFKLHFADFKLKSDFTKQQPFFLN